MNMERIKFDTYEEIVEKLPIGKKINYKKRKYYTNLPYLSDNDLKAYKLQYGEIEILDSNYCRVCMIIEQYDIVEGYLFDGEYWFPVKDTWDGWIELRGKINV